VVDTTNALRFVEYCVKHRREVARRGINDLQYLGGRGLLLQGLARLGQEPRVLHRDDRLPRKILQQCDLSIGKWPNFAAVNAQCAKQYFFSTERDG
jgi:hypothetical protein